MHPLLTVPLESATIMQKKKRIKRELLESDEKRAALRIAILGGSTTAPVKDILELFLLDAGFSPCFFESEYNKWYEDIVFENAELKAFNPQIIYIHTSVLNLADFPSPFDSVDAVEEKIQAEFVKYRDVWEKIGENYNASVIQNNFELPPERLYGNMDFSEKTGTTYFINGLNAEFAKAAEENPALYIQDINYLSATFGLSKWFDRDFYALYKIALASDAVPLLAHNLAAIIKAISGKSKKCLVLDIDNTLWGGIVGDDGADNLVMGSETAEGEAFIAWQRYILRLKERGVILAVCSKNDEETAKGGFNHPDCLLKLSDFAAFRANWEPKPQNIESIAKEINIGLDSVVFIDDNPAEREIVRGALPMVTVPKVSGGEPFSYIRAIEYGRYFETAKLSSDDLKRAQTYAENKERRELAQKYESYDDFLQCLNMEAEILPFSETYLSRIAQLTNKTNQFNLTTKRFTEEEIRQIAECENYIALYGRLKDKLGDNGLISVIIGEKRDSELHIFLWLMSCRVLKRDMEYAMSDVLAKTAKDAGIEKLVGYYYPTKKNAMVKNLYADLGFAKVSEDDAGNAVWAVSLKDYSPKNRFIKVKTEHSLKK